MLPEMYELNRSQFPKQLLEIPKAPKRLYAIGRVDFEGKKILTVVGPRKHTNYSADIVRSLIYALAGMPVIIVSGLAYGIDSIAHLSTLEVGLPTIAFPGSGLNENAIYPRAHFGLAKKIVENGGMLISEFAPDTRAIDYLFPQRNRLVAGIAHAVLIPEASEKSGTLITAKYAIEYNRDLLVVPGNINNNSCRGSNNFLRLGATPITCADDLREALGFERHDVIEAENLLTKNSPKTLTSPKTLSLFENQNLSTDEQKLLSLINEPKSRNELIREFRESVSNFNITITLLEMKGMVKDNSGMISTTFI